MTIDHSDVIHIVATDPAGGEVLLIVSDRLPWDLRLLHNKLELYLHAIATGQLHERFPKTIGTKLVILIVAKSPLSQQLRGFFDLSRDDIRDVG